MIPADADTMTDWRNSLDKLQAVQEESEDTRETLYETLSKGWGIIGSIS